MIRTAKIFCRASEQAKLATTHDVVARYDAFAIVKLTKAQLSRLARSYPVEDITDQFVLEVGDRAIDTTRPRVDVRGKVQPHPAYNKAKPLERGSHHYLVQFIGPIKRAWLAAVRRAGGEPREPYSDFTYVVRADEATRTRLAALPFVRWIGHLPHRNRIEPGTLERAGRRRDDMSSTLPRTRVRPGVYTVLFFGAGDLRRGVGAVKKLGFELLGRDDRAKVLIVETHAGKAGRRRQLEGLAAVHGVRSVSERVIKRRSNNVAAGIMQTARAMGARGLGLSGRGETVAVCDSGLDTGDAASIHRDFARRVAWIKSYPMTPDYDELVSNPGENDGPADVSDGHGTHVAGSVLGNGASSAALDGIPGRIRGLAYKARLIFQAVEQEMKWIADEDKKENERYELSGIPLDLTILLSDAYKRRARIHTNSWGGGAAGAYDEDCEQIDGFVWKHKDFCVLVAGGNDGTDKDGDGKINRMSVTSPATAKNCITVGACESHRPECNAERYGGEDWWRKDYPVAPFRNDPMADEPKQVVAFSSRGPTRDLRVKPDVLAPGTFILSTRSTQILKSSNGWRKFGPSKAYFFMGGTSMATPLVAGAVALVREYLRKRRKIKSPSAALLKAALINGATRLPGTAPAGALLDNHQGFGRVNLDAALAPPAPATVEFIDVKPGLQTGKMHGVKLKVKSDKVPLRITLAYSDYPAPSLVNNLNLIVVAPDGVRHIGNHRMGSKVAKLDARNNVEMVLVPKPIAGAWSVDVVGSNVPRGPQDFALAYSGHI